MSLFEKKAKKHNGQEFPYSLALSFGIFLLTCVFSLCYANPAYNPSTGDTWQTNPLWQICFFPGVYGLLFVLDFGVKYVFRDEENVEHKFVPWAYFGISFAEFVLILVTMILYFVAYPGTREGLSWTGRIAIAIAVCVLCAFNILIRIPKYIDFKGMFENPGKEIISIALLGALTIIPQLILLVVVGEHENRDTARAATIFSLAVSVLALIAPFFATKLLKNKEQTHLFSLVTSIALAIVFLVFLVVYQKHYTQKIDKITYEEVYWSVFTYGYSILVSLGVAAYHAVRTYLIKKH